MKTSLIEKVQRLPTNKKREVEDFVDFLISKTMVGPLDANSMNIKPGFGGGKGLIVYMADDFDEPLDADEVKEVQAGEKFDRGFGSLKGKIWMSDNFDEPLDDLKA